jgi:hypothetical protein
MGIVTQGQTMQREQLHARPAFSDLTGNAGFRVLPHAHHRRLYHIEIDAHVPVDFIESQRQMSSQHLEYVPTARFVLAKALDDRRWSRRREARLRRRSAGKNLHILLLAAVESRAIAPRFPTIGQVAANGRSQQRGRLPTRARPRLPPGSTV